MESLMEWGNNTSRLLRNRDYREMAQECEYSDYGCYDLPEVLRPGLTVLCGHVHKPLARDCDYRGANIVNSARRNTVFAVDI